jgi:hypothetical protein
VAAITVRGYRGELATLDANSGAARSVGAVLTINGAHTIFRDFEVISSDSGRTDQNAGFGNSPVGINFGPSQNIKLVNLVIHDLVGSGIGAWAENVDAEIYGCLIYNNGLSDHDHGIYVQNQLGSKRIADNIIFNQASHGIHAFASSHGFLDNITVEGNTVFGSGELLMESSRNILVGGEAVARNPVVRSNYTYLQGTVTNNNIGYTAGAINAVVQNNYWIAGNASLELELTGGGTVTGNLFVGPVTPDDAQDRWPLNEYRSTRPSGGQVVFVRPNAYEPGRANVTIYNWGKAASVDVDLASAGLVAGDTFDIRDAQDFFAPPVVTGMYLGMPVAVPMTGLLVAAPVGAALQTPPHTGPEFGAFVLIKTTPPPVVVEPPAPVPPPNPEPSPGPPVPPFVPTPPASSCLSVKPAADWICLNGAWLPPGHPLLGSAVVPPESSVPTTPSPAVPPPSTVSCTTIQPVADWICLNGGWLPPGHPLLGSAVTPVTPVTQPPAAPPPDSGCALRDPFVAIGGGVCVNGGWVPKGHRLAGGD